MDHILNLLQEQNMNTQPAPAVTERAQITMATTSQQTLICRFNSVKKGEAAYEKLCAAWLDWKEGPPERVTALHVIKHDMFVSTIDLSTLVLVNFVDHNKRDKFVPFQG